jgi:hypothetical protein
MLDNGDINKMHIKENKQKTNEGSIYGTKDKITDFHSLENITIVSHEDSLVNILDTLFLSKESLEEKIKILKEVILSQQDRIQVLEQKIKEYIG